VTTLVTGAFGCIGAWVIRGLLVAGERPVVFGLGDDPWRVRTIAGPDAPERLLLARGDITDRGQIERVVRAIEAAWPPAKELITHVEQPLPFPAALDDAQYQEDLGPAPSTSLIAGVQKTLDELRHLQQSGRLDARELA
jgi:nucleoside-diphosphate-sugar epimerase